jgi:hypothetical protein
MYDGDSMTVRTLNPSLLLDNIVYEISLSGTSDVDLDPSVGEYIWEDCTWTCSGDAVSEVILTSVLQSRMTKMTVTVSPATAVSDLNVENVSAPDYYDLQGRRLSSEPTTRGIYIKVVGSESKKIIR